MSPSCAGVGVHSTPAGRRGERPAGARPTFLPGKRGRWSKTHRRGLSGLVSALTRSFLSMLRYFKSVFHSEFRLKGHFSEHSGCDRCTRKAVRAISRRPAWGLSPDPCVSVPQTGLSGNLILLAVLYKGGLLMGSAHMTVGELSSFLMYAFWVGLSIAGTWPAAGGCGEKAGSGFRGTDLTSQRLSPSSFCAEAVSCHPSLRGSQWRCRGLASGPLSGPWAPGGLSSLSSGHSGVAFPDLLSGHCTPCPPPPSDRRDERLGGAGGQGDRRGVGSSLGQDAASAQTLQSTTRGPPKRTDQDVPQPSKS